MLLEVHRHIVALDTQSTARNRATLGFELQMVVLSRAIIQKTDICAQLIIITKLAGSAGGGEYGDTNLV